MQYGNKNLKVVGVILVSRCGKILHYSIPNLLKWCDWVLLMMDNEDEITKNIVFEYKKKYHDRIRIGKTGFKRATKEQEKSNRGLFHRFKPLQGPIREKVFEYLREVNKKEKIDILIFPDSDEIFSDSLKKILDVFVNDKNHKAITFKPIDVYGDMKTLRGRSMTGHTRIMKFSNDITAIPYRTACNYLPFTRADRIRFNRVLIHLATLTIEKRNWRAKHWKPVPDKDEPLWRLNKNVFEMTPEEILNVLQNKNNLTIKTYTKCE